MKQNFEIFSAADAAIIPVSQKVTYFNLCCIYLSDIEEIMKTRALCCRPLVSLANVIYLKVSFFAVEMFRRLKNIKYECFS